MSNRSTIGASHGLIPLSWDARATAPTAKPGHRVERGDHTLAPVQVPAPDGPQTVAMGPVDHGDQTAKASLTYPWGTPRATVALQGYTPVLDVFNPDGSPDDSREALIPLDDLDALDFDGPGDGDLEYVDPDEIDLRYLCE